MSLEEFESAIQLHTPTVQPDEQVLILIPNPCTWDKTSRRSTLNSQLSTRNSHPRPDPKTVTPVSG